MSSLPNEELLGPFAVGTKIGGGGMAAVYLGKYVAAPGEEPPPGQEVVALKIIKGEFVTNPEYEKMFLDEAQILTQLSHPNVIRTVGYGAQAGAWFIAMELLMGRSLLDVWEALATAKKRIPFDLAAWIVRDIAHGLQHAHDLKDEEDGHSLNLVHRDVNPSNIFIGYDGSVKLIDFGLAKARKRETKSADGMIKGKIPYLSPEQLMDLTLDGRSDIYSLGTTLWELTTMQRLFKRDNDVATVRAIQKGEVPDARKLVAGYPQNLWQVVEKSLVRDREHRYASAAAMADDIDKILGQKPSAEFRARLLRLTSELFPGEAEQQRMWLAEATGEERPSFIPPVSLAEVPPREQSAPVDLEDLERAHQERLAQEAAEAASKHPSELEPLVEPQQQPEPEPEPEPEQPKPATTSSAIAPADRSSQITIAKRQSGSRDFALFLVAGAIVGVLLILAYVFLK